MNPRQSLFLLVVGIACSSEQPGQHRKSVGELSPAPVSREGYVMTPDAVRLYYRVAGAGPDTIVFVHGGPGGSLEEVVAGLVPLTAHHVVIFYDQRGGLR